MSDLFYELNKDMKKYYEELFMKEFFKLPPQIADLERMSDEELRKWGTLAAPPIRHIIIDELDVSLDVSPFHPNAPELKRIERKRPPLPAPPPDALTAAEVNEWLATLPEPEL